MTLKHSLQLLALAASISAVACGGSASISPTAPTGAGTSVGANATTGAVITGRVTGATTSAQLARTADGTASFGGSAFMATTDNTITVTVVGSGASTTVGPTGEFTLTGVPAGSVQLLFSGRGATAQVTLSGVQATDRIEIAVTLNGSTAHVESENRQQRDSNGVEVNGRVSAKTATSLTVGTTLVDVPAAAVIRHGNTVLTLTDIKIGDHVEVKGTRTTTGITASEVKVESNDDDDDDTPTTTGTTPTSTGSNSGKGNPSSGKDDAEDDEDDDDSPSTTSSQKESELKGLVTAAGSTAQCPLISFTISGVSVTTTAATKFDGIACTAIKVGSSLEVKGTKTGTTMTATKVEKN